MDVKKLTAELCSIMSIDGFEYRQEDRLLKLTLPYFDSCESDKVGNHVFLLKSKRKNAKKLFIDTHYDEIGLMVKGITDDGMLRVCSMGGVDARILPSAHVIVYGNEEIPGIVAVKPQNLISADDADKLVPVTDLLVDIGYNKEKAQSLVPLGSPVGFKPEYTELGGGKYLSGKGLDDKVCGAAVIYAISMLNRENLGCDIYFSMSSKEEVGQRAVSSAAFRVNPDLAVVLDVTFGLAPGGDKLTDRKMGGGAVITRSVVTDKTLSDFIIDTAKEAEIPYQTDVCPIRTGTHADDVVFVGEGIPTALVSIPVWFMHTQSETVSINDIENTAKLLCRVIEKKFGGEEN